MRKIAEYMEKRIGAMFNPDLSEYVEPDACKSYPFTNQA